MDTFLYWLARCVVAFVQALPMTVVARIGRTLGWVAYWIDGRHRRVALKNLTACFGDEKTPEEIRAIAMENYRRIAENYITAVKSAAMSFEQLQKHLTFTGGEHVAPPAPGEKTRNVIMAIGHFGNFELYAHVTRFLRGYRLATTYRGLRQPGLNRLMQSMRERTGCIYFDRRAEGSTLREYMSHPGSMLGLLIDQRSASGGLRLPFLGRECEVNGAAAVFARRYNAALHPVICYRTGLGQWHLEWGPEIPTRVAGKSRTSEEVMIDVHRALEAAVRRDPANWFWVHDRWKMPKPEAVTPATPAPAAESPRE